MRKYFSAIMLIIFLVTATCTAADAATAHYRSVLTGGGTTALDGADGARLNDGDLAFVAAGGVFYIYKLDASSGAAESSPLVIAPDTNAGTKRWILQNIYAAIPGGATGQYQYNNGGMFGGKSIPDMQSDLGMSPDDSTENHLLYKKKVSGVDHIVNAVASDFPTLDQVPTTTVGSGDITVSTNNTYVICTAACNVTPKAPAAGVQLCVRKGPGATDAITLVNLGASKYYELTDNSAWATANQKLVSGSSAATDKICIVGYDSTHYATMSSTGTWTDTAP